MNLYGIENISLQDKIKYSRMKLGCFKSIESYSSVFKNHISSEIIKNKYDNIMIVCPGTGKYEIPNSISYIAKSISKKIQSEIFILNNDDKLGSYEDLSLTERTQLRSINSPENADELFDKRTVFLIDDSIAGGGTIEKSRAVIEPYAESVIPIVLIKLDSKNIESEGVLNRTLISTENDKYFRELWSVNENHITSKLVKYTIEYGIKTIVGDLSKISLFNIYVSVILYSQLERLPLWVNDIVYMLCKENIKIPTTNEISLYFNKKVFLELFYSEMKLINFKIKNIDQLKKIRGVFDLCQKI